MLSDAPLYAKNHNMQERDTILFLKTVVSKMDWTQEDQDVVMDIGCGPGTSTRSILLPTFSGVKKVIAMDVLRDMVEYAKKNEAHEKIEYHYANIEDSLTMEKWTGQISKVISIYCFNWLENQIKAFRNVYKLLRSGGEAALFFALSTSFWNCYSEIIENPKWNKYLKNVKLGVPESHYKRTREHYYRDVLKSIGFNVILCETENRTFSYPSDDICKDAAYSRCALTSYIPDELKNEFKEHLFQGFLKYSGRGEDGNPILYYTIINILVRKMDA